jgi:Lrp/AsnC family leucine-responsive transcriptional regulator
MNNTVKLDASDVKILHELIKDARMRIKDIAKDCGLSSAAVSRRIKRLRATGVITGSVLFSDMSRLDFFHPASIGVNLLPDQESQVIKSVRDRVNTLFFSRGIGKENLSFFVVAHNLQEIDNLKQIIRKQPGIRRITVSHWNTPCFNFENIDLRATRA